jgi:hypothetical protein
MAQWRLDHAAHIQTYTLQRYWDNAEAIRAQVRLYYSEHAEERRAYSRDYDRRRREEDVEGLRAVRQSWRDAHRENVRAYNRQWKLDHPEQVKAHNQRSYLKKLEAHRATRRAYYRLHTAEGIARTREWRRNHPQRRKLADMRRDARKAGLPDTMTAPQTTFLYQYWGFACAICGQEEGLFGVQLVMDHWIALADSRCPGTVVTNMIVLCNGAGGCNTSKKETDPVLWLTRRYGKRKAKAVLQKIAAYFTLVGGKEVVWP